MTAWITLSCACLGSLRDETLIILIWLIVILPKEPRQVKLIDINVNYAWWQCGKIVMTVWMTLSCAWLGSLGDETLIILIWPIVILPKEPREVNLMNINGDYAWWQCGKIVMTAWMTLSCAWLGSLSDETLLILIWPIVTLPKESRQVKLININGNYAWLQCDN